MRKFMAVGLILAGALVGCKSAKTASADACSHCPGVQKLDANGACEMCHGKEVAGKCSVCDAPKKS